MSNEASRDYFHSSNVIGHASVQPIFSDERPWISTGAARIWRMIRTHMKKEEAFARPRFLLPSMNIGRSVARALCEGMCLCEGEREKELETIQRVKFLLQLCWMTAGDTIAGEHYLSFGLHQTLVSTPQSLSLDIR